MKYIFTFILIIVLCQAKGRQSQNPMPLKQLFTFHNGYWINLHHFLYYQALLKNTSGKINTRKLNYKDTSDLANLSAPEKKDWQTALAYYNKALTGKDLLFDSTMVKIKDCLENDENERVLIGTDLPAELQWNLNKVAASYRAHFWRKQNLANELWIENTKPLIKQYGEELKQELEKDYCVQWPQEAIRVDVTNYASWSGAYTTLYPNRITVSSVDTSNQRLAALEVVFHEASHTLIDSIARRIMEICQTDHKVLPNSGLWHAILFYTTGETVRRHFKDYIPYAYKNGLWKRAWPMYIGYLELDWQPYLDKKITFEAAIEKLVKDVEVAK